MACYKLTLEPPIFFSTIGFMLTASVSSNLLIYRTCYALLHYNKTECALLGFDNTNETQHLEELVEPTSTYISLVKMIVESTIGSLICLYTAPWSDRYGRKPVLVAGFLGCTAGLLLHIVFAAIENLTPWFLLVVTIPMILTGGGGPSFGTIIFAYMSDSTTKEERAFRMGVLDVVMTSAVLLGNTLSSYLLIATNYVIVYCVAAACQLIALIYTILLVPESLQQRETENQLAGFFKISNFIETLKAPFKVREHNKRAILLLVMATMLLGFMTGGSGNIFTFFVREKLHWTLIQITWFGTADNVLGIIGTLLVVYILHTVLKIKEPVLILVGFFFSVASSIMQGFAIQNWQIYLAALVDLPSSGQDTLMRSLISKLVHEDEVAKILSAFSIGSNILSPLSSTAYTALYDATINTDAGLFNFITAALILISSFLFMVVINLQRSTPVENYTTLESGPDESCGPSEPENLIANEVKATDKTQQDKNQAE